jgi:hypothetical protein
MKLGSDSEPVRNGMHAYCGPSLELLPTETIQLQDQELVLGILDLTPAMHKSTRTHLFHHCFDPNPG